jgi:Histidine kinase
LAHLALHFAPLEGISSDVDSLRCARRPQWNAMNPNSTSAAAGPGIEPVRARLASLRRSALFVLLLCSGIALLLTAIDRGGFGTKLIYSFSIGICCWFIIDSGRYAAVHLLNRLDDMRGVAHGQHIEFPGWPWMILIMLVGMTLGPIAGHSVADLLTGNRSPSLLELGWPGTRVTIVLTVLGSIISVFTLTILGRLAHARALAEAAQRAAAENQLKLLESQLEPHMLFNTLANLRVLIGVDPPRAQAMLDQLIAFLRATLGASRVAKHPLRDEFARLADYLALMQIRMGARLRSTFDLPDELATAMVPPLLLQPLVENAIKHGLEPNVAGGRVDVSVRREDRQLVLSVRDTGVGLATMPQDGSNFGLTQVRARLAALYGERASLRLAAALEGEGGTLATIRLPLDES